MKKIKKIKARAKPPAKRRPKAAPPRKKIILKRTRDLSRSDSYAAAILPRIAGMTVGKGKRLPSVMRPAGAAPMTVAEMKQGASDALPTRPAGWKAGPATRDEQAQPRRFASQIRIGKRFRTNFDHVPALALDFNERGMLQPPVIDRDDTLIAGECRVKAWEHPDHKLRGTPLPVIVVPIADLLAAEWAENDPALRKPFRPEDMVAIKRAMEAKLGPAAKARQGRAGATRGQAADGGAINVGERVAAFAGKSRRSIEKMEAVVDAAEAEPEKYGRLKDDMNKSGNVDGPFRRLQNLKAAEAIRNAPAPLPGNGPYGAGMIDFPHAGEPDGDDPNRAGRGYYPYPTMNTAQQIDFMRDHVAPLLAPNCTVGFWITNYHLTFGHHLPVLESVGLIPRVTLSFCKDIVGRGQVARGSVEFLVIASRGDVVIETFPRTDFPFEVNSREHSRKDQAAFELFARHVPASRYFSLFETVARGALWDCHGDKIPPKAAPHDSPPPCGEGEGWGSGGPGASGDAREQPSRPPPHPPHKGEGLEQAEELKILEAASRGAAAWSSALGERLKADKLIAGKKQWRLLAAGGDRLHILRVAVRGASPMRDAATSEAAA